MNDLKINHFAVWVGIILQFFLGFLWYGPFFGEPWMAMVGLDMDTIMADPAGAGDWITNIIASVAGVYLLAIIFVRMNVDSFARELFGDS